MRIAAVITLLCVAELSHPLTGHAAGVESDSRVLDAKCEALTKVVMPETVVTTVQSVAAGVFSAPGGNAGPPGQAGNAYASLPAFCRYAGVVAPKITFEVWLPQENWNGHLEGVGNGGLAGSISYGELAQALKAGFAAVSTDTGHAGNDTAWLNDTQALTDYGSRAIHEMTVRAKTLAKAYYKTAPARSYFSGCSTGGGQALMSAQRYPADYDGILAGAANWNQTRLRAGGHIWAWSALHETPQSALSASQFKTLTAAVIEKCDLLDGVKDGLINDPRQCHFDPAVLACGAASNRDSCLNEAQVRAVTRIYAGSRNPRTGEPIWPAYVPGSETGWGTYTGATPFGAASTFYRNAVFRDPNYDFANFDFDADVARAVTGYSSILDATSVDLRPFRQRGGKLLMYHGFADPMITPLASVQYYEQLVAHDRALQETQSYARLFMLPGVGHCGGGAGPDQFDGLQALQAWVEKGTAPERIVASRRSGGVVDQTRPLCPWPKQAAYQGAGDTQDAASFSCR